MQKKLKQYKHSALLKAETTVKTYFIKFTIYAKCLKYRNES